MTDWYVGTDPSGEFPPGGADGANRPTLYLVLVPPGAPGPDVKGLGEGLDTGSIVVTCRLHPANRPPLQPPLAGGENVEIRGHTALVSVGTDDSSPHEFRTVNWIARLDNGEHCQWIVGDSTRFRSLKDLVALVDALVAL